MPTQYPAPSPRVADLISRWSDPQQFRPGTRVVVRSHLSPAEQAATGMRVTDVIGVIDTTDPLVLVDAAGHRHTIDPQHVAVIKVLPRTTVRNSQIRAVEYATAQAFPGIAHTEVDGWLLRAGDGITERSNSAVPLGPAAGFQAVPLPAIEEFYATHHLPVRLLLPDRLSPAAERLVSSDPQHWERGPEIVVMTRDLDELASPHLPQGLQITSAESPDDQWLGLYHFRGQPLPVAALRLLMASLAGEMRFFSIVDDTGRTVAITRATVTEDGSGRPWLGLSAVEVAPQYRRRGLGTALEWAVLAWARQRGAAGAFLQAQASNTPGLGMYRALGFVEHHYHRCFTARY